MEPVPARETESQRLRSQTLPCFFQERGELLQFSLAEVPEALLVEIRQRSVDLLEHSPGFGREIHMNDPAIFLAAGASDEAVLFEPVEQTGHGRHDLDHAATNLVTTHRAAFTPEDAEHVVL